MRIHAYTITPDDLRAAAEAAGAFSHGNVSMQFVRKGSRTHDLAYEVNLFGDGTASKRRSQADRDEYAATWDQWGVFLAELFVRDPDMKAGPYNGSEDFHRQTGDVFARVGQ